MVCMCVLASSYLPSAMATIAKRYRIRGVGAVDCKPLSNVCASRSRLSRIRSIAETYFASEESLALRNQRSTSREGEPFNRRASAFAAFASGLAFSSASAALAKPSAVFACLRDALLRFRASFGTSWPSSSSCWANALWRRARFTSRSNPFGKDSSSAFSCSMPLRSKRANAVSSAPINSFESLSDPASSSAEGMTAVSPASLADSPASIRDAAVR